MSSLSTLYTLDSEANVIRKKYNKRYESINSVQELLESASEASVNDHNAISTPST